MFLILMMTAAPAIGAEPELGANAALKYWQAFGQMRANLNKDNEKIVDEWQKVALDDATNKLLDATRPALVQMRRGTQIERCDWSLDYNDGPGLLLPHLVNARTLTKLVALHIRREMAQGRPQAAVDDALAVLTMARHCNADFTLISILVRYVNEATIFDALAPSLPKLDAASLKRLAAALDAPPGGNTVSDSILAEKKFMAEWLIRKLKEAEANKAGSHREVLEALLGPTESKDVAAANAKLMKTVDSFDKAIKLTEGLLPMYDELARLYALPAKEFDVKYPEFDKKAKASNAMAALLLPGIQNVAAAQRRNQAQRALFRAAIGIVQDGAEKAKETKDPFGDGPFEFRSFDGGFELKSKFAFKGNPVMLTVGQAR